MYYLGPEIIDDKDLRPTPASMPPPTRLGDCGGLFSSSAPGFLSGVPGNSLGALDLGFGAAVRGPPGLGLGEPSPSLNMGWPGLISEADHGAASSGFEGLVADSHAFGFTQPDINQVHDGFGGKQGSKDQPPWIVDREGDKYCLLCRQWSNPAHLGSKKHTRRVKNPDWYLWDENADGDGLEGGEAADPWADAAAAHARRCLLARPSDAWPDDDMPRAGSRAAGSAAPVLVSGQESWRGGPPPPPPPPKTKTGGGKGAAGTSASTGNGLGVLSSLFQNASCGPVGGSSLGGCGPVGGGCGPVGGPISSGGCGPVGGPIGGPISSAGLAGLLGQGRGPPPPSPPRYSDMGMGAPAPQGIAAALSSQATGISTRTCAWCSALAIEKTIPGSKARYCASCWEWWLVNNDAGAAAAAFGDAPMPPPQPSSFERLFHV